MNRKEILKKQIEDLKPQRQRKNVKLFKEIELETDLKRIEEAEAVGLEYIDRVVLDDGKKGNYCLYRFPSCGHEQEIQATHVRRDNFKCETCLESRYKVEGKVRGLTYIEKLKGTKRLYSIDKCGHYVELSPSAVIKRGDSCSVCYEEKLKQEAVLSGLYTYLGKYEGCGTKRLYKFLSCGHEKEAFPSCVLKKNLVCRVCQEEQYAKEAEFEGLQYNGYSKQPSKGMKRNYILPCGCEKDLRLDHVRSSRWCCGTCDDTHYSKPSKLYLLKIITDNFSWLKLGFAKDINNRVSVYQIKEKFSYEEIVTVDFDTAYGVIEVEKSLHKEFKSKRYKPTLMKNYMNNGHTECYPVEIEDLIVQAINRRLNEK